jgi:hypothetical protein
MANAFDQFDPTPTAGASGNAFDQFDKPKKGKSKETGSIDAFVRGAANAATFGFADRIAAGLGSLTGIGGQAGEYEKNLASQRAVDEANMQEHPVASIGGTVAGAAVLPVGAAARAPTLMGGIRAGAKVGAAQGAAYGAGSSPDLTDKSAVLTNMGEGAALGGALGGAVPLVAPAARSILNATGIPQTARGFIAPEQEALRQIGTALEGDAATRAGLIARRQAQGEPMGAAERSRLGLTPQEAGTALDNGAPITTADYGGEATRRLARQAANISPEASDILRSETAHRFEGQQFRIADRLTRLGGGDSTQTLEELQAAARRANKPAYDKAFAEGEAGSWHEGLAQLAQAPVVADAIKGATRTGANKAAAEGFRPVKNPFTVLDSGEVKLTNENVKPTLQFWDAVKRNLDDKIETLQRGGEKSAARDAIELRRQLVSHLDRDFPAYSAARGQAARFFGAEDALEAGTKFVAAKGGNSEYRRVIAKMSAPERALFAHGFMSEIERQINETGVNRSPLIKAMFQSPAARERIHMAIGEGSARNLETGLHVEAVMDQLRTAVTGNSTTAQQLGDVFRHGGLLGGGLHMVGAIKALMRHGAKGVDETVMQRVAEGLTSRNPEVYARALATVRKSPPLSKVFTGANAATVRAALAEIMREKKSK